VELEREAFLRAIEDNPLDPNPRHVYADWLDERGEYDEANEQRRWTEEMLESRQRIVKIAEGIRMEANSWLEDCLGEDEDQDQYAFDYDLLMEAATYYLKSGDCRYLPFQTPDDCYSGTVMEEFWRHYKVVTGADVEEGKSDGFFRCAC
jgi:uncharacterized protein (TIGR02996 family)